MGFLDKAKQMAEQAQQKIDDAQKQFNESQAQRGGQGSGGVRYDKHGRPIADSPSDPAAAPSPAVDPAAGPPPPAEPTDDPAGTPPPAPDPGGANANPDPFKPLQ